MKKKIITITLIALAILSIIGLFILIGCNSQSTKKTEINSNTVTHLNSYTVNAPEDITITDANMTGYKVADVCYCTLNIDKEKAFEKLKDYIVFYDGEPVHVNLDIKR